jgi:hypothetical protein
MTPSASLNMRNLTIFPQSQTISSSVSVSSIHKSINNQLSIFELMAPSIETDADNTL